MTGSCVQAVHVFRVIVTSIWVSTVNRVMAFLRIPTGGRAELGLLAILTRDVRTFICDRDHINRHRYSVISVIVTLPHDFRLRRFKAWRLSHRCATLIRSLHFILAFDSDETLTARHTSFYWARDGKFKVRLKSDDCCSAFSNVRSWSLLRYFFTVQQSC